jgi:HAD superfamily hydrolase (TIGR01490 family)
MPAPTAMPAARRVVAVFDFDGTLTERDTLVPFLVAAFGRRRVAAAFAVQPLALAGALLRVVPVDVFKRRVLRRLVQDVPASRLRALGPAHARGLASRLRPAALERIAWHRSQCHLLVLASATLDVYLDHVGAQLGFDHVLCTRLASRPGDDGVERLTGLLDGGDCTGPEKLRRLAALLGDLGSHEVHAYGDSAGDRELLAAADHAHFRPFRRRAG